MESIDIKPQQKIVGPSNKEQVTEIRWNPSRGAEIARQQMEERMKEEFRMQAAAESQDPTLNRLAELEKRFRYLENTLGDLVIAVQGNAIKQSAVNAELETSSKEVKVKDA